MAKTTRGDGISATQRGVLAKLGETGANLVRLPGGFWTYEGCPVDARGVPTWWVTWPTVRALERKGRVVRVGACAEAWKDARRLR